MLLNWDIDRFYDWSDLSLEKPPPDVIDPAINLVSVVALIDLAGAAVTFVKGIRRRLLYVSVALNSYARYPVCSNLKQLLH